MKWKKDPYIQKMTSYPGAEVTVESQERDKKRALEADDELYMIVVVKKTDSPIGYVRVNCGRTNPAAHGCNMLWEKNGVKDTVQML